MLGAGLSLSACGGQTGGGSLSPEDRAAACEFGELSESASDVSDCDIRVLDTEGRSRCFSGESQAHACACAGCALDDCSLLESYPAQVACQ